ncbi:MAG: LysR substrate-binding domain-containing protein [Burkholderiaceae bacterium]|jgi:DNA-binding transcriptional LysR family regulator|nr:LysR substrate-binding domain-containing protein [Burkholderiaceae bacterium]
MPSRPVTARARRRRPIQLQALRGFESAARHLSFTLAAAELKLTQSSISRQVAALEDDVGSALFTRHTRALRLTPAGERLFTAVQQALALVDRSVDEIRGGSAARRVTVATYASFASLWLVPRLAEFQGQHPGIEIRIDASDRMVDLEAEGIDIALRWLRPTAPVPQNALLLGEEEFNVAVSPRLLQSRPSALKSPADLDQWPVLAMDESVPSTPYSSWARWCELAGIAPIEGAARLVFTYVDQSVQAAVRGQGVALVRTPFLDDLVASSDLVTPFPHLRQRTGYRYFLIDNPQRRDLPHVVAFRQWVIEKFRQGPRRAT